MAFYLKPPRGFIDFHILQKCVEERLRLFKSTTVSAVSVHNIEYLYEDSAYDRAGHFTLRLAAVKDPSFLSFFVRSEVNLLKLRLDSCSGSLLRIFLKNQLRHAKECLSEGNCSEKVITFINTIVAVVTRMLTRSYRSHVFDNVHLASDKCKIFTLNVPFQHCVSLILKRQVDIKNGYVQIPCQKWKDLLMSLFYTYLRIAINEMHYSKNVERALDDERIKSILALISNQEGSRSNSSSIILSQLESENKFFPLCMQNLHSVLRKEHRLAHEERFNLSLFLKDIGVSLDDSITYWKSEYSKDLADCSKCSHNWQKDEKRYIYSIRHLYGLEGSRKTYSSRSCSYFQNMILSPMQVGGCPFKHFDNEKLGRLLSIEFGENAEQIGNILLERSTSPLNACKSYLKCINNLSKARKHVDSGCGSSSDCDYSFKNPVQYFLLLKNS